MWLHAWMCFSLTLVVGCFRHLAICSGRMVVTIYIAFSVLLSKAKNSSLFLFGHVASNDIIILYLNFVFGHVASMYVNLCVPV